MLQNTNLDLFAGILVADYAAALKWYERLLGFPPTFFPHKTEARNLQKPRSREQVARRANHLSENACLTRPVLNGQAPAS